MNPKLILCLALVLSGGLFGCSTNPPAVETKVIDYSSGSSALADGGVVQGLGKSFSIRASADSWLALIQNVKPTFAWNGSDMMWIESGKHGEPQFILDEAYIYQPTNQPRQWILVKDERIKTNYEVWQHEEWWRQFSMCNLRAIVSLQDSKPLLDDSGRYGSYALVKAANRHYGVVYEIGWQNQSSTGNAHPENNRHIYIFKDNANRWHFLGEGPGEGAERGAEEVVESQVVWDESKTNEFPLQIKFHCEYTEYATGYDDDTNRPPDVVATNNFVLAGKFPASLQELK